MRRFELTKTVRFDYLHMLLAAALCVSVVVGCHDPDGRQSVTGEITLNGQPLDHGEISLRPFDTGPSAAGRIEGGKFVLTSDKGPMPGKYLVRIESMQPTGKKVTLAGTSLQVDEMQQVVPDAYNDGSQLVIEVSGTEKNHYEFELKAE